MAFVQRELDGESCLLVAVSFGVFVRVGSNRHVQVVPIRDDVDALA